MNRSILFRFPNRRMAFYAFDTLEELGYESVINPELAEPEVQVNIMKSDVTSALEIAQACGGKLVEQEVQSIHEKLNISAHLVADHLSSAFRKEDTFSSDVQS